MTDQDQIQALKAENAQLTTLLAQALARINRVGSPCIEVFYGQDEQK